MAISVGVRVFSFLFSLFFVEFCRYSVWRLSQHFLGDCQMFMQVSEISILKLMKAAKPEQWQIYSIYLLSRRRQQYLQKGNPEHVFLFLRFPRASGEHSSIFLFWRARFIDPPYPQNNLQGFFLIKKGRNGWSGLGTVFSRSNDRISVNILVFVVMNNPTIFQG